jgi:hypothetical protein
VADFDARGIRGAPKGGGADGADYAASIAGEAKWVGAACAVRPWCSGG